MCSPRKRAHPTPGQARAAIRSMVRQGKAEAGSLHIYQCRHCKKWYIGHKRGWGRVSPATWEAIRSE